MVRHLNWTHAASGGLICNILQICIENEATLISSMQTTLLALLCGQKMRHSGNGHGEMCFQRECATTVIREVYDGVNSQERFEYELECALEDCSDYIVIEPTKLGEETSRWIRVGNCLHKTAVLSGLISMVLPRLLPPASSYLPVFTQIPAAMLSIGCATLYSISWQFDPCCKYQVTVESRELSQLNIQNLTNASPVVLVRRDDKYRKGLHNCIAVLSGVFMIKTIDTLWRG